MHVDGTRHVRAAICLQISRQVDSLFHLTPPLRLCRVVIWVQIVKDGLLRSVVCVVNVLTGHLGEDTPFALVVDIQGGLRSLVGEGMLHLRLKLMQLYTVGIAETSLLCGHIWILPVTICLILEEV